MAAQAMHKNTFAIATLAGIAGATLALLFAPKSGRETRDQIKSKAHDMKEKAGKGIESAKDGAHQFTAAIKHTGQEAKEKYDETRENA